MQRIFQGMTTGIGSMLSFPATMQKLMIVGVVIGGLAILLLVGGLAWGIGSGTQNIAQTVKATGDVTKEVMKVAPMI
jgi:hypothetical protein